MAYNLFRAAVIETVNEEWFFNNQRRRTKTKYTSYSKEKLQTLPADSLIDIILTLQIERDTLLYANEERNRSQSQPVTKLPPPRITGRERNGLDYDKIEKQRAEIKAMKQRRKTQKTINNINDNAPKDSKPRSVPRMGSRNRYANEDDKIESKRTEIKRLKERMKSERMEYSNQLKQRNAHRTDNLFANPHEEVVTVRPLQHNDDTTSALMKKKKGKGNDDHDHREKIVDPVSCGMVSGKGTDLLSD